MPRQSRPRVSSLTQIIVDAPPLDGLLSASWSAFSLREGTADISTPASSTTSSSTTASSTTAWC